MNTQKDREKYRNNKIKYFCASIYSLLHFAFTHYKQYSKTSGNTLQYSNTTHSYCRAFSMVELLFVLVIIGILASIALPRINFSRTNALSIAIQSDIQTIISSTQEYAITHEITAQNANPQWLITHLNLSAQRWIVNGDSLKLAKNGVLDSQNDCVSIRFNNTQSLQVSFNRSINSNLCQNLIKHYANDITIPLDIAL